MGAPPSDLHVITPACYCKSVKFISSNKCILLPQKRNNITAVNVLLLLLLQLLHLFFISNSVVFVAGGRKNISCPRAQGTLATPLLKQSWNVIFQLLWQPCYNTRKKTKMYYFLSCVQTKQTQNCLH